MAIFRNSLISFRLSKNAISLNLLLREYESFVDLVTPAFSSLYLTLESNSRHHELLTSSRNQLKRLRLYTEDSHIPISGSNESLKAGRINKKLFPIVILVFMRISMEISMELQSGIKLCSKTNFMLKL